MIDKNTYVQSYSQNHSGPVALGVLELRVMFDIVVRIKGHLRDLKMIDDSGLQCFTDHSLSPSFNHDRIATRVCSREIALGCRHTRLDEVVDVDED